MFEDFVNLWQAQPGQGFEWQVITVIAIAISFSISAIAYMFSRFIGSEQLVKWAKKEIMYAISSAFIVGLLVVTTTAFSTMMVKFSMESMKQSIPDLYNQIKDTQYAQDPHVLVKLYLDRIGTCARKEYVWLTCLAIVPYATASSSGADVVSGTGLEFGTFRSTPDAIFVNSVNSASYIISYVLYTMYLQKHFILLIENAMLFVFLPLGILLRTFPMTRGAGNLFIAFSIGFYVVYPMGYAMMFVISPEQPFNVGSFCNIKDSADSFTYYKSCSGAAMEGAVFGVTATAAKYLSFIPKLAGPISKIIPLRYAESAITIGATGEFFLGLFSEMKDVFSSLVIYTIFYPFAVLGITLTFIKFFADFLGAGVEDFANGILRVV
jgi:hypothetical protein